jgi:hypothetical protein
MNGYEHDRAFSDGYIPELRRIIGPHLLVPSSLEQDRHAAADLVVLRARDLTAACRIRRPGYADQYPNQFTLRYLREKGTKTEFGKIVDGWGDWMFYGHATGRGLDIAPWWLLDLHAFRSHLIRQSRRAIVCEDMSNHDGTWFRAFRIGSFPASPRLVIAQSEAVIVPNELATRVLFAIPE